MTIIKTILMGGAGLAALATAARADLSSWNARDKSVRNWVMAALRAVGSVADAMAVRSA